MLKSGYTTTTNTVLLSWLEKAWDYEIKMAGRSIYVRLHGGVGKEKWISLSMRKTDDVGQTSSRNFCFACTQLNGFYFTAAADEIQNNFPWNRTPRPPASHLAAADTHTLWEYNSLIWRFCSLSFFSCDGIEEAGFPSLLLDRWGTVSSSLPPVFVF